MNWKALPNHVRIWIYQSDSIISPEQIVSISADANQFLGQWMAHGESMNAAFEIFHNRFLVFFVDEKITKATGCSIDKSVHFIQAIEKKYKLSLLDRMKVAFKTGGEVQVENINVFTENVRDGSLSPDTIVFDNLVKDKSEFLGSWEIPVARSWMSRFVPV